MIDILDVLCFFICGLFEVRSSPNLLQADNGALAELSAWNAKERSSEEFQINVVSVK